MNNLVFTLADDVVMATEDSTCPGKWQIIILNTATCKSQKFISNNWGLRNVISSMLYNDTMEEKINNLLWENFDSFVETFKNMAEEEIEREVISTELKDWWKSVADVFGRFQKNSLPQDD